MARKLIHTTSDDVGSAMVVRALLRVAYAAGEHFDEVPEEVQLALLDLNATIGEHADDPYHD